MPPKKKAAPASAQPAPSSSSSARPHAIRSSSPDHVLREIEDVPPIPFDTQEELSFVLEKLKEQFMAKVVASVSEAGEGKEAEQRATRWAEKNFFDLAPDIIRQNITVGGLTWTDFNKQSKPEAPRTAPFDDVLNAKVRSYQDITTSAVAQTAQKRIQSGAKNAKTVKDGLSAHGSLVEAEERKRDPPPVGLNDGKAKKIPKMLNKSMTVKDHEEVLELVDRDLKSVPDSIAQAQRAEEVASDINRLTSG